MLFSLAALAFFAAVLVLFIPLAIFAVIAFLAAWLYATITSAWRQARGRDDAGRVNVRVRPPADD